MFATWHQGYDEPKAIYDFDASTLRTVKAPFEGHTSIIGVLSLSFDGELLASASRDQTIKLWTFEFHKLLVSFDVHAPDYLIFSPNSHQLAHTTWVTPRYTYATLHLTSLPLSSLHTKRSLRLQIHDSSISTHYVVLCTVTQYKHLSSLTHKEIYPPYTERNVFFFVTSARCFLLAWFLFALIGLVILWMYVSSS
ncbi:hypothetical protein BDR07DRAFT_536105 [Suillus spraguei]|nr:hypothetical protein BDR07DRAFT_536105 [Suillus spraguei]